MKESIVNLIYKLPFKGHMELKSLFFMVFLILLAMPFVLAIGEELQVPKGEDYKLTLPLFSKTWVRVYEGSKIDFNIVDPDNSRIVLVKNSIVIKEIGKNTTKVLISLDGSEYEERIIEGNQIVRLNYKYDFVPYMDITQVIGNYNQKDPDDSNVVLFFEVPFLKDNLRITSPKSFVAIDPTQIKPTNTPPSENKILDPLTILLGVIVIVLIGFGIYLSKRKK